MFATVTTDWIGAVCNIALVMLGIIMVIPNAIQVRKMLAAAAGSPSATQSTAPATQTKEPKAAASRSIFRVLFDAEAMPFTFILAVSGWRLVVLLSDASPVTRLSVFGVSIFTGLSIVCLCYLTSRMVMFVLIGRFRKREGLDP